MDIENVSTKVPLFVSDRTQIHVYLWWINALRLWRSLSIDSCESSVVGAFNQAKARGLSVIIQLQISRRFV